MSPSSSYAAVMRIAGVYAVINVPQPSNKTTIIAIHSADLKAAQAAAKIFAERNNIPYSDTLLESRTPIITVMKSNQNWVIGILYPDHTKLSDEIRDKKFATATAAFLAEAFQFNYVPDGFNLE